MTRKESWPEDLEAVFVNHTQTPFLWGAHDCLLAVCNCIQAMTGIDPAVDFRGQYETEIGALRMVKERGHDSLESLVEALCEKHEMKEIGANYAQRGDVVLFDGPEGVAFGIVHHYGADSVCVGPDGLRRLPTLTARRAWRVG